MRKIYIDDDYRVHVTNPDGSFREFEVTAFDGKCDAYAEGCRYIPPEESWTRSDGKVFRGESVAPWKPSAQLAAAQDQYDVDMAALQNAFEKGVNSI